MNSPVSRLPRPFVAGIGFVSSIPALVAQLPSRLPGIALTSAIEARTKYLEYLRAGEALLGGGEDRGRHHDAVPDTDHDADPDTFVDMGRPVAQAAYDRADADPSPDAADLPIEDYDGLSLASIRARLPRLDSVDIRELIDYETTHAARLPVLTMLSNRLAKLADD